MTHDEARAASSASLDGQLEAGRLAELEAHLASCGECRGYASGLGLALGLLERALHPPEPPQELAERIVASLPGPKAGLGGTGFVWVFAVLLGGAALAWMVVGRPRPPVAEPLDASAPSSGTDRRPRKPIDRTQTGEGRAEAKLSSSAPIVTRDASPDKEALDRLRALEGAFHRNAASQPPFRVRGRPSRSSVHDAELEEAVRALELDGSKKASLSRALASRRDRFLYINELKRSGKIGEGRDGLLSIPPGAPGLSEGENTQSDAENADRRAVFAILAVRTTGFDGTSLRSAFATARAGFAEPGHWIEDPEKGWRRVGEPERKP